MNPHDPVDLATCPEDMDWEIYWEQMRLIAEHVKAGGKVATAPRWEDPRHHNLGISASPTADCAFARAGAAEAEGLFDADAVLTELLRPLVEHQAEMMARDAARDPGRMVRPDDWAGARRHTTIPRLFTDAVVYDSIGYDFWPRHVERVDLRFRGRLHAAGHGEVELGLSPQGLCRIDLVDADSRGPGSGVPTVRCLWGDEADVVGAIECGAVTAWRSGWVGLGDPGLGRIPWEDPEPLPGPLHLAVVRTETETSVWWFAGGGMDNFLLYALVNAQGDILGVVVDASGVALYQYEDPTGEIDIGPWPDDATEYDPFEQDRPTAEDL